jgi:lipopolysaccharide transport system ATP-binding protein
MSDLAVRVENLSKRYALGAGRHNTLRETLVEGITRLLASVSGSSAVLDAQPLTVWALSDVSFDIKQGDFVSIIGPNGSGKSTLLKILSRLTEPTKGRVEIRGRVGSLLEVGTGFHPELTGRENIYLNAAILGMKKPEIARKFDEIVAFSGVEKFIDTPVKRYSSGMYVRLAFSVAAHLEPDILMIDEVLSVGDASFRNKCAEKMGRVTKEGRTVVFVSHDMTAVANLSSRAVLLESGKISCSGPTADIVNTYLKSFTGVLARGACSFEPSPNFPISLTALRTYDEQDNPTASVARSSCLVIKIEGQLRVEHSTKEYLVAIDIRTMDDMLLFRTHNIEQPESGAIPSHPGPFMLKCTLPRDFLPAGIYRLGVHTTMLGERCLQDFYPVLEFEVVDDQFVGNPYANSHGLVTPRCQWSHG